MTQSGPPVIRRAVTGTNYHILQSFDGQQTRLAVVNWLGQPATNFTLSEVRQIAAQLQAIAGDTADTHDCPPHYVLRNPNRRGEHR